MKFRKKPVVIDAIKWDGKVETSEGFMDNNDLERYMDGDSLLIYTLEGWMTCKVGDWIIKGVKGEFYSCKPDIFEMTYEPV